MKAIISVLAIVTAFAADPAAQQFFGHIQFRDTPPGRPVKAVVWRDGVRRQVFISPVAAGPR